MGRPQAILFSIFIICAGTWFFKMITSEPAKEPKLHNGIYFSGIIVSVKASDNHAFGVILVKLHSANRSYFNQTLPDKAAFPYKIEGGKAEIYTTVSEIEPGDSVMVKSNDEMVYYYHTKSKERDKGGLQFINYSGDKEFIAQNTALK